LIWGLEGCIGLVQGIYALPHNETSEINPTKNQNFTNTKVSN